MTAFDLADYPIYQESLRVLNDYRAVVVMQDLARHRNLIEGVPDVTYAGRDVLRNACLYLMNRKAYERANYGSIARMEQSQ